MARHQRPLGPPTFERLERSAFAYLQRYATSRENLRRVLARKVHRAAKANDLDPAGFTELVDRVVARCAELGLVDDTSYAETRIASLRRRGRSSRRIRAALSAKGVEAQVVDAAMQEDDGSDLAAAIIHARRRRIGPWRRKAADDIARNREIASMCRAGFPYGIARRVIEAEKPEDLGSG